MSLNNVIPARFLVPEVPVTKYVMGAFFSRDLTYVALIQKNRPEYMKGKLNLIGGHVEDGESYEEAMVREFYEETGYETYELEWSGVKWIRGDDFIIKVFTAIGDVEELKTWTDERVYIETTKTFLSYPDNYAEALPGTREAIHEAVELWTIHSLKAAQTANK